MWILPKNYLPAYHSVLDMVDSSEELSELSESLTSSLMWRSKPSPLRTWLTRWKRNRWLQHLSGRILKPSHHIYLEIELTSSLEGTLASRSAPPERGKEQMTHDICGHTYEELLETSDLLGVSLRTSMDMCRWDSPQSSAIWKKMVTKHRGEYSARLKLERHTNERESSYMQWPTVRANEWKGCAINTVIRKDGRDRLDSLDAVVRIGHRDRVNPHTVGKSQESSKLNPDWVEQLMGLPVGWTQLSRYEYKENRTDRLRLLGNGVVPQTAEKAFRTLLNEI